AARRRPGGEGSAAPATSSPAPRTPIQGRTATTSAAVTAATTRSGRSGIRREGRTARSAERLDEEEGLPVLHRLPVLDEHLEDAPAGAALDLVHELHRLDDADDLPFLDDVAL